MSNSSITICPDCFGIFSYTVNQGDTLQLIAQRYGISANTIESYNNITAVRPGQQILLPFYYDTIKTDVQTSQTDVQSSPNQNAYDYDILMYAAQFHLNPMLIKAQIYVESNFNKNQISQHDQAPGVCGTGHSYGLLQYTPACFSEQSNFGITQNFTANSKVLLGQDNGMAVIECLTFCSAGDYFVQEYSNASSSDIVTDLVQNPKYAGWNNSVFNPQENLFAVMQVESMDIQAMVVNGYTMCSYTQYNEMALAQYQQSTGWVISGCGTVMGGGSEYISTVLRSYSQLSSNSTYGWNDEYQ
jgi:hypothetical protein